LSDQFTQIKDIVNQFLQDPHKTACLFRWLEIQNKQHLKNIEEAETFLDTLEKAHPEMKSANTQVRNMIKSNRVNTDTTQFIYYILEILASRSFGVASVKDTELTEYDPQKMLSEKDRKSLDWLNKYLERTPSGEPID
jgi:hypothetical protein